MRGVFITFEGPEGCGKTTQIRQLIECLEARGIKVVQPREPGGTPTGEVLRDILLHDLAGEAIAVETEALLFAASRAQLVRHVILPALERGDCVLCDRFADSTTVYQGIGRGIGIEPMIDLNAFAIDGAEPDITILLDMPIASAFERVSSRNDSTGSTHDRFEREAAAFHETVRSGYLELAERFPDRIRVVDAARDAGTVHADVWALVSRAFADAGRPLEAPA